MKNKAGWLLNNKTLQNALVNFGLRPEQKQNNFTKKIHPVTRLSTVSFYRIPPSEKNLLTDVIAQRPIHY
jgi:hypothetical protein